MMRKAMVSALAIFGVGAMFVTMFVLYSHAGFDGYYPLMHYPYLIQWMIVRLLAVTEL